MAKNIGGEDRNDMGSEGARERCFDPLMIDSLMINEASGIEAVTLRVGWRDLFAFQCHRSGGVCTVSAICLGSMFRCHPGPA